ncbi:GAF domain-containing protein [Chloroflexus sp.]|uniref:GAF domain-containing protein n=1 Tax=Chloroflexus sp. TaxID=1904827 RepID=UPI00298EDFF3|nr:GAF domain-containing protein [Chloroflexus sp.]MDW8402630.1 GAF domain-containing protein [Chloroflexus sp.]
MKQMLSHWLQTQQAPLLQHWNDLRDTTTGSVATQAQLDLQRFAVALAAAASDDDQPLRDLFSELMAPETGADLPALVRTLNLLHRATRAALLHDTHNPALIDALADLFEQVIATLVEMWSEYTNQLIHEREFIAASLDAASAAADQRALQLKALNDISQRLSATLDRDALLEIVIDSLHRLTDAHHVAVWLVGSDQQLCVAASRGSADGPPVGYRLPPTNPVIQTAFAYGGSTFWPSPPVDPDHDWIIAGCSVMIIPMIGGERLIGAVTLQELHNPLDLRFMQDLAQSIASQAAIALQNADLYHTIRTLNTDLEQRVLERTRELEEEKDRLATLHAIASQVNQTLDLDQILNNSLEMLARIVQAEHASILLVEEDNPSLLVTRAILGSKLSPDNVVRFAIGQGIAGWAAQHGQTVLVHDVAEDERWVSIPGSTRKREGSMISVPLFVQGEVIGVMTLSHPRTHFFHEGHVRLLNACAGAIAIGINNANLFRMISAEAERRYELLDRQQKETSKIAAILQSLLDGVIVSDLYGGVLSVNQAASRMLHRPTEELLLWNLHDIIQRYLGSHAAELPLDDLLRRPLSVTGEARTFSTTAIISGRTINFSLSPVLKEDEELLGALLVLRDITREVEADRMKNEFIGTMSHELRTPMTAIKGFTQLLAMGGLGQLNDTQREFVNTIYSNTERMINLINDVLEITKIESGSIDLEWRSLHLAEALSGVIAELQPQVAQRQHQLSISLPPGLPLIRADATRLHQILYHLLLNAIKYTPAGGKITIAAREALNVDLPEPVRSTLSDNRRYLLLSISDTGVGIRPEDLPRIFDRFFRADNPLKVEAGGTGLGLSIVKPLVELLGGRIWVESTVGEGSTFFIALPVAAERA